MRRLAVAALAFVLPLSIALVGAGCGEGGGGGGATTSTGSTTTTTSTTPSAETTAFRVYFLRNGQVWPVPREVPRTKAVAAAALGELLAGPSAKERSELGLTTGIPAGIEVKSLTVSDRAAKLELSMPVGQTGSLSFAQVVYTLAQFPTVDSVDIGGTGYTQADFEDQTPPILVESPLAFQEVASPIRVTGTANTFEATFQYELRDASGKILSKHFEMATSGSGTRGTFAFKVPYSIDRDQAGMLVLYENSAEDGSRIHVQKIPLRLKA